MVELVGEGSVTKGAYTVLFLKVDRTMSSLLGIFRLHVGHVNIHVKARLQKKKKKKKVLQKLNYFKVKGFLHSKTNSKRSSS